MTDKPRADGVRRFKMPWLDDPLEWPRELRRSGTEIVLASDYDALQAENARLRAVVEALSRYAKHSDDCESHEIVGYHALYPEGGAYEVQGDCTCGFDAELAGADIVTSAAKARMADNTGGESK